MEKINSQQVLIDLEDDIAMNKIGEQNTSF